MPTIDQLLSSVNARTESPELHKTAEARFLADLQAGDQIVQADNPYAGKSLEELTKLAQERGIDTTKIASEVEDASVAENAAEEIAYKQLLGRTMAHALTHEFGEMKIALASGKCRICKESDLDIEGSSVCTSCRSELSAEA